MDSGTALATDKKRNKLGYHRTSVACVHCRRRKIRCLLAPGDAQGRCENCIRLKKECNFYPVDQQPPVEKKSRSGSKIESGSSGPSTTSSPSFAAGSVRDQAGVFSQYPPAAGFGSGRHMSSFDSTTPTVVSMSPFKSDSASPLGFRSTPPVTQTTWGNLSLYQQSMMSELPVKPVDDSPPVLWNQDGSAMPSVPPTQTSAGLPMASPDHIQVMNSSTGLGIRQQARSIWQPPAEGTLDLQQSNSPHFPEQFSAHIPAQNLRSTSYQSLNSSIPELIPGQIPVSFDPTQPSPASFGYQAWNSPFPEPSPQGIMATGSDPMGGWYADPLHYPRTREPE